MDNSFDVIVVGVGAMGAATCLQLASRGSRVLGLEQFGIPNALGSSHGQSRAIRLAYYEHPDYVPLLQRSYALWRDVERLSGQHLLYITGGLYIGPPQCELVSGSKRSAESFGLRYEELDRSELAERFPQFELPADYAAIYELEAGLLRPELSVAALANLAMRQGAVLHGCEKLLEWNSTGTDVTVRTTRGRYRADRLILCGGAWTSQLMRNKHLSLSVTRQLTGWVWPRKPEQFELGRFPTWAIAHQDGTLHYGFPMLPDSPGFQIAHHYRGNIVDPDVVRRDPLEGDEDDFLPVIRRFIPDAQGPLLSMSVCLYTSSPDSHFIIDQHPDTSGVFLACGFSGHGFKFSAVVGEALADLAQFGRTQLPIGFLGLQRFAI